jgi:hypothetical protein
MRAYASRTGTARNLTALLEHGWGLLVSASGVHRDEGFGDIMLDNGAWSAHTQGSAWDPAPFETLLALYGAKAHQIVAPDIVGGGPGSLDLSVSWLPRLAMFEACTLLCAQDGLEPRHLRPYLGASVGVAVGGSTRWKWRTLASWCELGKSAGARVHDLRANSARMLRYAKGCGAYSVDGSGPTRFAACLPRIDRGRRDPAQTSFTAFDLDAPFTPKDTP